MYRATYHYKNGQDHVTNREFHTDALTEFLRRVNRSKANLESAKLTCENWVLAEYPNSKKN